MAASLHVKPANSSNEAKFATNLLQHYSLVDNFISPASKQNDIMSRWDVAGD